MQISIYLKIRIESGLQVWYYNSAKGAGAIRMPAHNKEKEGISNHVYYQRNYVQSLAYP